MKRLSILFALIISFTFISCSKDDDLSEAEQLAEDLKLIDNYLSENDLTAKETDSGLHYIITDNGSGGGYPTINSTVTVKYTGYYLNGTEFDSGTSTFSLTRVIKGWQEGIPKFKKKGRGQLFVPSYLAYGPSPNNGMPANAVLVFDIYLISFN